MHGICVGEGPRAHLQKLAECIRWSYGAGIILRLGNIARLELNYCFPMGVQSGDRYIYTSTEPHSYWIKGSFELLIKISTFFCSQSTHFLPLLGCFELNNDGLDKKHVCSAFDWLGGFLSNWIWNWVFKIPQPLITTSLQSTITNDLNPKLFFCSLTGYVTVCSLEQASVSCDLVKLPSYC